MVKKLTKSEDSKQLGREDVRLFALGLDGSMDPPKSTSSGQTVVIPAEKPAKEEPKQWIMTTQGLAIRIFTEPPGMRDQQLDLSFDLDPLLPWNSRRSLSEGFLVRQIHPPACASANYASLFVCHCLRFFPCRISPW